jgi:hypothetical protein
MLSIRIHRRASAIVAIALAATAVSASASSARVLEAPFHQTGGAGLAVSPIPAQPSEPGAVEAQAALAHFYTVPTTAGNGNAEVKAHANTAPTAAIVAPKPAAPSDTFSWGDAAIGAAIAMGIVLLITTAAVVVRRRTEFGGA